MENSHVHVLVLSAMLFFQSNASAIDLEKHPGKAIYSKLCLECHGASGEGNAEEEIDPLVGKRSLESLAGRIERTMPEDEEDLCVGPDAKAVAEYIFHAFYSPEAQARNRGFRKKFSRLTVDQYRNSVMDVFGHFRNCRWTVSDTRPGLSASYSLKGKSPGNRSAPTIRTISRVDSNIDYDYGEGLPDLEKEIREAERKEEEARKKKEAENKDKKDAKKDAEKGPINHREFSIRWRGGIFARHTGVYEFFLRTRNGAYLNINEPDNDRGKLIDAWVAPNNDIREESAKIFLVGGRTYQLDLHFFKYKEDQALVELLWKPPHGIKETVPHEVLSTRSRPKVFVSTVRFPADDRSLGYETGASISRAWMDAITNSGLEAANFAADHLSELAGIRKEDGEAKAREKVRKFCGDFAELAYRRPLSDAEKTDLLAEIDTGKPNEQIAHQVVLRVLTSPEFLYPDLGQNRVNDSWANGQRLAAALWDSIPDKILRMTAAKGQLDTEQRLERWAERMLDDSRTRYKIDGFFHHWLELDRAADLSKDKKLYPEFNKPLVSDLRQSLELFLDEVVWSKESDYRQLLLSQTIYTNDRMAKLYGTEVKSPKFEKVAYQKEHRSGVITHPLILSAQAYHNNSSPVHRGVFLSKHIVGLPLKPPKEAIVFDDNQFDPSLTMREKVTKLTESKACMACHASINPLGFSLEHFDAMGRWRTRDAGKKVDDDTVLKLDSGETHQFKNPRDLANFAAASPSAHQAFIRHLFHHIVKQPMEAYGLNTGDELYDHFKKNQFSIKSLMVKIAVISATRGPSQS